MGFGLQTVRITLWFRTLFTSAAWISCPSVFAAQAQTPAQFIETLGKQAIQTLTQGNPEEIRNNFEVLLKENFDLSAIAANIMGKHWRHFTPPQKEVFIKILVTRMKETYALRFEEYKGVVLTVHPQKSKAKILSGEVDSTLTKPGGAAVKVAWRVNPQNGNRIQDVLIEGISMTLTMKAEYSALYQKSNNDTDLFLKELSGA